ncbi:MAG: hypothetical protein KAJ63_10095, partial [Methyloprofundus sp.]|nr:hypothetical protein [Methyloprofundus sp.]
PSENGNLKITSSAETFQREKVFQNSETFNTNSLLNLDGDPIEHSDAATLDEAALQNVVDTVIGYLAELGTSEDVLSILRGTELDIKDLGKQGDGKVLSEWDGSSITFDDDAAGHGWSETIDSVNSDEVDLLSAVVHEFGHVLGYGHDDLNPDLTIGERDLPYVNAEIASSWTVVDDQIEIVGVQEALNVELAG